jgi:CubicO group peptidase (beta-lactamase class C family)
VDAHLARIEPWPDGLERVPPAVEGVSSTKILAFLEDAVSAGIELHGFMLMRNARVVAEGWWSPYRPDLMHMTHSVTKSVLATAIGMALDERRLAITDMVTSFFPGRLSKNTPQNLQVMTVRDLLTMQTGHDVETSGSSWRPLKTSWVDAFFNIPVPHPPGTHWQYTSAASYMLSAILTTATGLTAEEYLRPRFFAPMGITNYSWDVSPEGYSSGGNGLSWTTADSLKLGALYAGKGRWNGQRLLSEHFIAEASRDQTGQSYGYHWWMGEHGAYYALGRFGQYIVVFPQFDAVLAIFSAMSFAKTFLPTIWKYFPAAFHDAAPVGGDLTQRLKGLALSLPATSGCASRTNAISDNRYRASENDQGITELSFTFQDGRCRYRMSDDLGNHEVVAGFGTWVEQDTTMTGHRLHHEYQPAAMRVTATARWIDSHTLEMTWQFVESAFRDTVLCNFGHDSVTVSRSVNVNSGETSLPTVMARQI